MRVLLTGASGQLGAYLVDQLLAAGHDLIAWSGSDRGNRAGIPLVPVDLTNLMDVTTRLDQADPEVILHAAAMSAADAVRRDPERGRLVNVTATATLANWCARRDRRIVFTSTDLVFDGSRSWNREDDPADPVLAYGRTKREAEGVILAVPHGLVARVSLLYGSSRCDRESPFEQMLAPIRSAQPRAFFEDEYRTPIDFSTAAALLSRLAESRATGLIHVAGPERMSRFDLARRSVQALGLDPLLVRANRQSEADFPEPRPVDVSLDTSRLASIVPDIRRPSVEEALVP